MKEKLRLENIIAEVNGIKMLNDFHLSVEEGTTLGLFIKESRVKRVLTDILDGVHKPLKGYFFINDKRVDGLEDLQKVFVVEGQSKLIDGMNIANNIFIVRSGFKEQFVHDKVLNQQATLLLDSLGIDLDPRYRISELTTFEKVQIELAKAYGLGYEVIVLKDLSAYFTDRELEQLKELMSYMMSQKRTFVLIDSFYDVLSDLSTKVIWVKEGYNKWVIDGDIPGAFLKELTIDHDNQKQNIKGETPIFQFKDVTCGNVENFSLNVYKGEIINFFDKTGDANTIFKKLITGELIAESGQLTLDGKEISIKNFNQAIDLGIGYIGENPTKNSLFPDLTCLDNLSYIASRKMKNFWMHKRFKHSILNHYCDRFDRIDASMYIDELSVSDKQRLVYYKWLAYKPDILIVQRPFTSVDQILRQLTYDLINELSDAGIAVILMSVNKAEMIAGRYYNMTSKENTPFSKK